MKHTTDIDSSKIQTKLTESTINKVISTRIRCARNLSMFPLNTVGTKETRIQVVELMEKVVKELPQDLAGELLRLDTMT
jgi:protein-arginine kinase